MSDLQNPNAGNEKGVLGVIKTSFKELSETFSAFIKAPRALWGVNIPYVIEGLVYFGILTILGKYGSENVELSDLQAGWFYSFVTGGITISMVILGGYSDKIGIRFSLALALFSMLLGRFLVALSGTLSMGSGIGSPMFLLLTLGFVFVVAGYGLYQPAAYAGVKRYTNKKTASVAYAVIYGLMNLGAFFSGFVSPGIRHRFEDVFPPNGLTAVFWFYVILTFIALLTTTFILTKKADKAAVERIKKEDDAADALKEKKEETLAKKINKVKINNIPLLILSLSTVLILAASFLFKTDSIAEYDLPLGNIFGALGIVLFLLSVYEFLKRRPDHPFRDKKFVFFIFILIPVQTLFAHNWLTIPYYLDRAFTGSIVSEYFELFSNLNPILIFVLAPIVAGLTAKRDVYKMMIYGTFIMALPTFLLAIGPNVFLFLTYVLIMSVGEAMWQPRFLQWIAEIAPEGKTGAYMGIGQLPWFMTKIVTGLYSGYFVATYIPHPDTGQSHDTSLLWLFYGFIAMISPIALLLAKKWMDTGMRQKS